MAETTFRFDDTQLEKVTGLMLAKPRGGLGASGWLAIAQIAALVLTGLWGIFSYEKFDKGSKKLSNVQATLATQETRTKVDLGNLERQKRENEARYNHDNRFDTNLDLEVQKWRGGHPGGAESVYEIQLSSSMKNTSESPIEILGTVIEYGVGSVPDEMLKANSIMVGNGPPDPLWNDQGVTQWRILGKRRTSRTRGQYRELKRSFKTVIFLPSRAAMARETLSPGTPQRSRGLICCVRRKTSGLGLPQS